MTTSAFALRLASLLVEPPAAGQDGRVFRAEQGPPRASGTTSSGQIDGPREATQDLAGQKPQNAEKRAVFRAEQAAGRRSLPAMHRTLVWTSKGGTGKTTTVANLGPELARLGYRVLLVGFDPQGDLETTFGIDPGQRDIVRVEQLLAGGVDPRSAPIPIELPGVTGSLALLASSPDLLAHSSLVQRRGFQDLDRLLEAFKDDVDLVLIDTQGATTPLSQTAARAADSVLFCMEPGIYEINALASRLVDLEELERDEGFHVEPLGVLFTRTQERSKSLREFREHLQSAEDFGTPLHVFDTFTRQQASVRDHPRYGKPTVLAEPASNVAADYRAFASELIARIQIAAQASA